MSALSFSAGTLTGSLCCCLDNATTATSRAALIKAVSLATLATVAVAGAVASEIFQMFTFQDDPLITAAAVVVIQQTGYDCSEHTEVSPLPLQE